MKPGLTPGSVLFGGAAFLLSMAVAADLMSGPGALVDEARPHVEDGTEDRTASERQDEATGRQTGTGAAQPHAWPDERTENTDSSGRQRSSGQRDRAAPDSGDDD